MQNLINDLLTYSRAGSRGKPFAPVDMNDVVDIALLNLKTTVEDAAATVTHGRLPVVTGDEGQLGQLVQNLVSNAVKFRGDAAPEVRIEAQRRQNSWLFSVADNGIGIEPAYFERIFRVFQRLHGMGQYEGTGIGLSICKRIVERHGGLVWVESDPSTETGSTFYFTIPE
jgi:light-regulated signal transduction histidine kinase (bacteriophytochrome)